MKKYIAIALFAALGLSACASTSSPLPQAPAVSASVAVSEPPPPPPADPTTAAPAPSTCDLAREAILTGTPADITKAMNALVADKTANATAREYARYYTGRDKDSKDLREMDVSLIQMSCS